MRKRLFVILTVLLCVLAACAAPPAQPSNNISASERATATDVSASPTPTATQPAINTPVTIETATTEPEPATTATQDVEAAPTSMQEFAFVDSQGQLQIVTLAGDIRTVWSGGEVDGLAWAPDGERLAFVAENVLRIWTIETDKTEILMQQPPSIGEPSWSADGKRIAITTVPDATAECYDDTPCSITVMDGETGRISTLGLGVNPVFAPKGEALFAGSVPPLSPQMREGEWSTPIVWPRPDAAPITIGNVANTAAWNRTAWSADGAVAAANNVIFDAGGVVVDRIAEASGEIVDQDAPTVANGVSPDGSYIALATLTITGTDDGFLSDTTLSLLDRRTREQRVLWRYEESTTTSSNSPSTTFVTNMRDRSMTGHGRVWRVSPVTWSPDGQTMAFTGCGRSIGDDRKRGCGLWLGTGTGNDLRLVDETAGAEGVEQSLQKVLFSPDGSTIVFTRFDRSSDEPFTIWSLVVGNDATAQRVVAGTHARWRP